MRCGRQDLKARGTHRVCRSRKGQKTKACGWRGREHFCPDHEVECRVEENPTFTSETWIEDPRKWWKR